MCVCVCVFVMCFSSGKHEVFESWSLLRESVDLVRFLMDWAVRVLVLASQTLWVPSDRIVSVASDAVHKADIVFCKTRFISSDDTVKGGEDDCEEASESGLQLLHRLSEVYRIDVSGVSVIQDNIKALEPNLRKMQNVRM